MGKPTVRKKKSSNGKPTETSSKHGSKSVFDQDMAIFIDMLIQLKEEGTKYFQKWDYEGVIHKYDKAIKLLPKSHKDIAYLHCNIAACYMQMKPQEYYCAINACNLALESSPKYTKALIKRARCFEAINRVDLAFKDVDLVLSLEPNNVSALEISERVRKLMDINGIKLEEKEIVFVSAPQKIVLPKEIISKKKKKDKSEKSKNKLVVKEDEVSVKDENIVVVEEKEDNQENPMIATKFVYTDDIRNAQIPTNCTVLQLREIVCSKFPSLKAFLVKYKDTEGDLVTITSPEELNLAKTLSETQNSIKLFITEVNIDQELVPEEGYNGNNSINGSERTEIKWEISENGSVPRETEDWIIQFARLFKNHVGLDSDSYLDLHDLGIKLYTEAMEETLTSEEAQEIFSLAEKKYQEMACLAFFNWGNVHMSKARKMLYLPDNISKEEILKLVQNSFEYSKTEYTKAQEKYQQALRVNPEFYEAHLALSQQYFEQAKLHWYYTLASESEPSETILLLFNQAEENMEKGTQLFSLSEETRLKSLHKPNPGSVLLQNFNLRGLCREVSADEAAEVTGKMKSQINILWGTMVYERSRVEFKLGFGTWEECLMESIEKFKDAGARPADIAVMIKNHCANETAQEGFGFKIDEIIQAWNEMYDAKRWTSGVPSFRLEPLLRRRAPKLHNVLEHLQDV